MIAKTVVAIGSLSVALVSAGCLSFYEIAVETPIHAKLDVSPFQRVLVAGFLAGGSNAIDPNTETARLLRSQLRTKSELRVIDADVLSLVEEVDKRRGTAPTAPPAPDTAAATQSAAANEPRIKTEADLAAYQDIFKDTEYWKKLGAEHQTPLIVTGSVLFTELQKSGMMSDLQQSVDQLGRPQYTEVKRYAELKGYALTPVFIFIDGRTGEQLYSESFHEEALYQQSQSTPALSSYFELMDKLLPGFLNTLSTQKIKGVRTLIK